MDNIELSHHGIKGMKWGVRRTPAQLGHKPSAKKKSGFSLFKKKQKATTEDKPRHKSPKDMSNDELQSAIRNMQLQQQYNQLKAQLEPQKKGKGFVKSFVDDSVKPAAIQAGKSVLTDYLTKMGKKYLGIDGDEVKDTMAALKKEVEGLELVDRKGKAEDNIKNRAKRRAEEAANQANKEDTKTDDSSSESTKSSRFKKSEESKTYKKKVFTGEVVGEGTSKKSETSSNKKQQDDVVLGDADWKDLGTSSNTSSGRSYVSQLSSGYITSLPASHESSGRSYVSGLLEEPR